MSREDQSPGLMMVWRCSAPLWLLVASVRLVALQPTFHTETRLVQINVVVRDKHGPVANLTKDDFTLSDAGKPRPISVFSVVSTRQSSTPVLVLPENTFSNRVHGGQPPPSSITVILLDRLNTLRGAGADPYEEHPTWIEDQALAMARQHLMRFVATLNPNDHVAIYSLGKSLTVLSDFTNDRARLLAVLEKYQPTSLTTREEVEPLAIHTPVPGDFDATVDRDRRILASLVNRERAQETLSALAAIAGHVADIPGRKNLVWLTANLPFSAAAAATALSRANVAVYPVDARGLLPKAPEVDPGLPPARSALGTLGVAKGQGMEPTGIPAMEQLASETGGRAFINNNDLTSGIRQAIEDAAVTYTLGFYVDAKSLDSKFHKLEVRVKTGGYDVRYPRGYFAVRASPAANENRLFAAIHTPLESSDIGLYVHVDPADQPPAVKVLGAIDLHNLDLDQTPNAWKGAVDVYFVQEDSAGDVLDQMRNRYNLQLSSSLYAEYLKSGVFFRQVITPKASAVTLRVLVEDPRSARIGSVIIPLK